MIAVLRQSDERFIGCSGQKCSSNRAIVRAVEPGNANMYVYACAVRACVRASIRDIKDAIKALDTLNEGSGYEI